MTIRLKKTLLLLPLFALLFHATFINAQSIELKNVATLGLQADQKEESTQALQKILDSGEKKLFFPAGNYLLGTVTIPAGAVLSFAKDATVTPHLPALKDKNLLVLGGNNVEITNLTVLFPRVGDHEMGSLEINSLIFGKGIENLRVSRLRACKTEKNYGKLDAILLKNCRQVEVSECETSYMHSLVRGFSSQQFRVLRCRATYSEHITLFEDGSEWLLHEGNWSDHVRHQCQWWGGDADARKKKITQKETSYLMYRDIKPGDANFTTNAAGAYDIQVLGNYAQYGMTLTWGSKGRNILISNNVSRYMTDMAYDSEGGENVVITNNIAINSKFFGIGTYFWGNNILISGNMILVEDDGPPEYQGNFIRMHSPSNLSLFGNGHVLISNNLCISKKRVPRAILLEAGRDITISGNKLVNGRIRMNDMSGEVSIVNNEILNDLSPACAAIACAASTKEVIIRNNIFRRTSDEGPAVAEQAAITFALSKNGKRIIEQNVIEGWKYSIWTGPAMAGNSTSVIRNNTITGELLKEANTDMSRLLAEGNINPDTLKPVSWRETTIAEQQKAPRIQDEDADAGDNALAPVQQQPKPQP